MFRKLNHILVTYIIDEAVQINFKDEIIKMIELNLESIFT